MDGGDLPDDPEINVRIVVGHNVSHPSHLSEGECGHLSPCFIAQVSGGFANDFDLSDHGILLLRIGSKIRL